MIPKALPGTDDSPHFTRTRKLPLHKLIVFLLSMTVSGKHRGVDGKSGEFFKQARRSGLWPDAEAVHRSAVTKARSKLPWQVLQTIHQQAVQLAYDSWPDSPEFIGCGMNVIAFDGSKYSLPASDELRNAFDPDSGLDNPGKGHYPHCLVSTAYDVFRRIPVARTVMPIHQASEREEVKRMLPQIPENSVLLFDRGYPSFDLIKYLDNHHDGLYLFRCPASSTFPAIEQFVQSGDSDGIVWIDPTSSFLSRQPKQQRDEVTPIRLRAVRLESPDGTVSVLLTNLINTTVFPADRIVGLYFRRWEVESYYRDEKCFLGLESFHSKTENGIRQELFAVMIMSVIARLMMVFEPDPCPQHTSRPQFKNAVMALASDAALLASEHPELAIVIFREVLDEIARVRYYPPKKPRPSQPRVCKASINKWQQQRADKLAMA